MSCAQVGLNQEPFVKDETNHICCNEEKYYIKCIRVYKGKIFRILKDGCVVISAHKSG